MNIGILLGPTSGGLTDIDLDCAEAIAIAPYLLPKTKAIFGRTTKRASHWLYYSDLSAIQNNAAVRLQAADQTTLLEVRIGGDKGAQTIFPGSVHVSGEPILWDEAGKPADVDGDHLLSRVKHVAAACLIARAWPPRGGRHDAARMVGGLLARAGWTEQRIKLAAEAIARAAVDEEWKDRVIIEPVGNPLRRFLAVDFYQLRRCAEWLSSPRLRWWPKSVTFDASPMLAS